MSTYVFGKSAKKVYDKMGGEEMYQPTLDPVIVGQVIAQFRKQRGLSQEVLSGLADIGRTHLSAIERGERKPTLETLYRMSMALNTKMSDIVKEIEQQLNS